MENSEELKPYKRKTELSNKLGFLLTAKQVNPTSLSRDSGVPQPTIFRMLNGESSDPRTSTLAPIAAYFGVSLEDLRSMPYGPFKIKYRVRSSKRDDTIDDAASETAEETLQLKKFKEVPIVGTVQGGIDGYLDEFEYPVGYGDGAIDYPTTDINAYALRVRGESMRPRIKSGEYIVVTPNTQAQPGDDVVVICNDGRKMVKELLYYREDEITLGSINSSFQPISLLKQDIKAIHFVAGIIPRGSAFVK